MLLFSLVALFAGWTTASLHHLFVGTVDGGSLYVLELDDMGRTLTLLRNNSIAGASPSIALDQSKAYLFGSRPSDGTVSRYSVGKDFSFKPEGTIKIPQTCGVTSFENIKLTTGLQRPWSIYGSASTGTCSSLFSLSAANFKPLRSDSIAGDVRSFAWSPNGKNLHALDSKANSLLNYVVNEDPNQQDLVGNELIANTTTACQVITHPVGHRLYVITHETNELIDVPLLLTDRIDAKISPNHTAIMAKDTPSAQYVTTSVAISSSNATLWIMSHMRAPENTFLVTVFRLDPVTGAVQGRIARSQFRNYIGDGMKATSTFVPAPFEGDMVAFTTYPGAMVAVLGLVGNSIAAYGRVMLAQDEGCCGDAVWLD